ncbi:antibiotic biosynthesis monooxygenase family protein [Undibacterium crateris]|uniref:antibiotic biosynthesis monooxygenase family protein n=1 Tax=Undibacterium crateris TaxID=2528175 RepID=UPI001389B07D|nr:antibiotic biosynthesis monooxygenase [Undibacterium crateris]NDI85409.1 antibiotic biosynthesis monooxygenase [Undibacterium crateris]
MIAVIFEVSIKPEGPDALKGYQQLAAELGETLQNMDGFISIERFQSLREPGKILSLSFWRDEDAVRAWRDLDAHRAAQIAGRSHLFSGYRLRIAAVIRDYGMTERDQAPADSKNLHGGNQSAADKSNFTHFKEV